jgi:hypothetical protein
MKPICHNLTGYSGTFKWTLTHFHASITAFAAFSRLMKART